MREPALVAELCDAMREGAGARTPLSVKCRIGVDDDDSYEQLARFVATVTGADARVRHVAVHARKAILGGLSPADNRRIPPLRYDVVERLARDFPHVAFTLNGGVLTYEDVEAHLAAGFAGVMVGRQVTARPWYWAELDTRVFGAAAPPPTAASRRALAAYGERRARARARIAVGPAGAALARPARDDWAHAQPVCGRARRQALSPRDRRRDGGRSRGRRVAPGERNPDARVRSVAAPRDAGRAPRGKAAHFLPGRDGRDRTRPPPPWGRRGSRPAPV